MLRRLLTLCASAALTTGLLVGLQAPAEAHDRPTRPYEQGTNDDSYSDDDTECGFTFHIEGRFRNRYKIYRAPHSSEAFLLHSWYRWEETLTNPANGKRMYVSGTGYFREVKATHLEGTLYEFIVVESGAPFTVRDSRGRIVLADRGTQVFRSVQDTLGDGLPSSEEVSVEVIKSRGHFPSWEEDFDFCEVASRLIG